MSPLEPADQETIRTLEAELRQAIQHRRAAVEQEAELRAELEALIERARGLLQRPAPETNDLALGRDGDAASPEG